MSEIFSSSVHYHIRDNWAQQLKRDGTVEQLQTSDSGNLAAGLKTEKNLHM